MADRSILSARGLHKTYSAGTPLEQKVLRGVDLEVRSGEFLAIIGQSGSGKSTLLNLMGALDTPTEGHLEVDGREIGGLDSQQLADLRNHTIGFVFQFHYLLDEFTVLENALMPLMIRSGTPAADDVRRVTDMLCRVGLGDQLRKRPNQISGGQQQRAAVIRALSNRPALVLADEPTGNLDADSGRQVFEMMREITRDQRVGFVMVTHDDRLARAADRVLQIDHGLIQDVTAQLKADFPSPAS